MSRAVAIPVGLDEALRLLVERARHRRPGPGEDEGAGALLDLLALLVEDLGLDARGTGSSPSPAWSSVRPGSGVIMIAAGLGLPPGVDDRAAAAADVLVVPEPGARVDRLADRAQQAQRGEVVLLRVLDAPLHAGADRGRRRVEDRDAVALDDLPPAVLGRVVGRALVHDAGRAVGERPVDDVGVAGDPADVGAAPVDVGSSLRSKTSLWVGADPGQVAAGRVEDALRLAGRARGVEDVERVLGVHRLGLALRRRPAAHDLVPEDVAALGHRRVGAAAVDDDDVLERRRARRRPRRPLPSSGSARRGASSRRR